MGKRQQKKLAKKRNNSGGRYVPPITPTVNAKMVPASATVSTSYQDENICWTARELDSNSNIEGVRWDLSASETEELLKFLENLSQKTWRESEAEVAGGHRRNHDHAVTDLVPSAQKRLRQLNQPEERIYRFRMSGKRRLWGFRSGNLFRILWYDPEHKIYPVKKRHT